jgi:hypothetical protein
MIASMFRLNGPIVFVGAPPTIATLSGLLQQGQIPPSDDLIAALTRIVRAFPPMSADYQLFEPIHAFALAAIQQSDPKLTADLSP